MGKTVIINSLEDMCSLMCDNTLPNQKEYQYCLRCGRRLKDPKSRMIGYGVICLKKAKNPVKSRLFDPSKFSKKKGLIYP